MRHAQYGHPDRNQGVIVEALRFAGCSVAITSGVGRGFPDLVVGRRGVNTLLEVKPEKDPDKRKMRLNDLEKKWHAAWLGTVFVVHSPLEALCAVGVPVRQAESLVRVASLGQLPSSVLACSVAPERGGKP